VYLKGVVVFKLEKVFSRKIDTLGERSALFDALSPVVKPPRAEQSRELFHVVVKDITNYRGINIGDRAEKHRSVPRWRRVLFLSRA